MVSALDVKPALLINKVKEKLKEEIQMPEYVKFVKSGAHAERVPEQKDFWYIRCASILYQIYRRSIVGVNRLRRHYGGRKIRGVKPEKHYPASGSIIRRAMVALEKAGYIKKTENGRVLTPKGQKLLDSYAKELRK
ncbi:MAG: 30S ribosomal protein S19e [Candidatus Micrarchaeota archaeon]|nr:30S ribosomal protein S19e [Candidatus Micrarchaeota archaeon]